MIQRKDLLAFDFYKKEKFTGSLCGMRYRIEKTTEQDTEQLLVWTWPGPYGFAATKEEKEEKRFPFAEESLEEIADYLNRVYEEGREK